ncbi:MAG TPA: hypothetical protein VG841_15340 [Caulobacterales bacterium]|nr:hypothetical protein [Caulobacterales bacterium]
MYQSLDSNRIVTTIERVKERIDERFPGSGLGKVCAELVDTARYTAQRATELAAPTWPLRAGVGALIVLGVAAQAEAIRYLHIERAEADVGLLQSLEAAVNLLILFGGAVWFLVTLEARLKRSRALAELHKLRSLAHVVDMHQLSKDPAILMDETRGPHMKRFDLTRYLDHCSDLLSLIGKLAALYADRMSDDAVIGAVREIEYLTTDLARKVWQKITIIGLLDERGGAAPPAPEMHHP